MEKTGNKTFAIIGLVLGALAICFSFVYMVNIGALVAGIVGLVLSVLAKKSFKEAGGKQGLATAALVVSIVGLVLSVIGFFTCTVCVSALASDPNVQSYGDELASNLADELSSALS